MNVSIEQTKQVAILIFSVGEKMGYRNLVVSVLVRIKDFSPKNVSLCLM